MKGHISLPAFKCSSQMIRWTLLSLNEGPHLSARIQAFIPLICLMVSDFCRFALRHLCALSKCLGAPTPAHFSLCNVYSTTLARAHVRTFCTQISRHGNDMVGKTVQVYWPQKREW
jgi:hypothetical protein